MRKTGIRAQIQHLKAYASAQPLTQRCVDPRYQYVQKGCAPYVEWLGIQESPQGRGWASGAENFNFKMKTVKKGEKGNHVLLVQEILKARGIKGKDGKNLKLDKDCDTQTVYAIKQYQRAREKVDPGICGGVDGVAGEKTLRDMIAL